MKKFLAPVIVSTAALLLFGCGETASTEAAGGTVEAATAKEERRPAPEFALKDADGKEYKLSDYKGKVVLLNFWATWCGPCKIEMPWFVDFQRKYKDQGFTVLAVSLDDEGWDIVRPFVDDLKLNFPVLLGNDVMADEFGGVVALPTTFMIDKEGKIYKMHQGLVSKGDYEEDIEKLL